MKYYLFSFQRCLTSFPFMMFLVLLVVFVVLFSGFGETVSEPSCGMVNEDDGKTSMQIYEALEENGLVPYTDRRALVNGVSRGEIDCGIVILDRFEQKLNSCHMKNSIMMIKSATSVYPDLYKGVVGTELFKAFAPHLTNEVLQELGSAANPTAVWDYYNENYDNGLLFTFDLKMDCGDMPAAEYSSVFFEAILSLLLFIAFFFGACEAVGKNMSKFSPVIGSRCTLMTIVIPYLVSKVLLVSAAVALSFLASRFMFGMQFSSSLAVVPLYIIAMTAAGSLMSAILPKGVVPKIIIPFWLLASMVMCPVFWDISAFVPALKFLKIILPPCWLYSMEAYPALWLAVTAGLVLVSITAIKQRYQ